jgi:hypothetical protein
MKILLILFLFSNICSFYNEGNKVKEEEIIEKVIESIFVTTGVDNGRLWVGSGPKIQNRTNPRMKK